MTLLARIAVGVACALLACVARGGDDFYERPPLRWADIEEPLRMFADVDDGPEWTQAWPAIERAYLEFLAAEDHRRTVDALPLAERYEPIELGLAEPRAVADYQRHWRTHLDRCHAAEIEFLTSVATLVPESARDAATALARGREIEWLAIGGITNPPVMATALRGVLRVELGAESRAMARDAVRTAELAMLEPLRGWREAGMLYAAASERQSTEASRLAAAGADADTKAMAAAAEEALAASDRAIDKAGDTNAAVERIGVDAILGLLAALPKEDRLRAIGGVGRGRWLPSFDGLTAAADRRIRMATRRFPADAAASAAIAAAREAWIDAQVEGTLQALRDLKADASLVSEHVRALHASQPSPWLDAMNEHARRRNETREKSDAALYGAVRAALGIPADHPWPRLRREDLDAEELAPDPAAVAAEELAIMERGLDAFTFQPPAWTHCVPDAASVGRLAARLGVDGDRAAAWQAERERVASAAVESERTLQASLDAIRRNQAASSDEILAAWRLLWETSRRASIGVIEAIRAGVPSGPDAEASFEVWASGARTSPAALVATRPIHAIGSRPQTTTPRAAARIAWRDRAANPLEALDLLALAPEARRALDGAIREPAVQFSLAAETLDEAELESSIGVELEVERWQRFFRDGTSTEDRMKGWIALNERRAALADRTIEPAQLRAAAARALRDAIVAALSEDRRADYERVERSTLMPGIDAERPRFERVFEAARSLAADDAARAAIATAEKGWAERWETLTAAMAGLDDGAAFCSLARRVDRSAAEQHGAAVLRWYEVRRREESIVAARAVARLLGVEARQRLPKWSSTPG